jgi:hydantoinase/oxoprolinase-like protein
MARLQMRVPPMRLSPNAVFSPEFVFARADDADDVLRAVDLLVAHGCEAIAASDAFGVDRPGREQRVVDRARARGVAATSGHDVASSYGLRARTRTAAPNAAILPTMIRTARMTADAAQRAGIAVPLMIMRSDGGVMEVREVERRPILTMLSGPAAGVALALVRDSVERTISNPAPADIVRVRREALERVVAAGAARELVEVTVELDPRRNLVRATASGATAAVAHPGRARDLSSDDLAAVAARALHVDRPKELTRAAETDGLVIYVARRAHRDPPWLPFGPVRIITDA